MRGNIPIMRLLIVLIWYSVFLMTLNVIFLKKNDIEIWRTILRFGKKIQNLHFYSVGFQKSARRAKKNDVHLRAKKNTDANSNVTLVLGEYIYIGFDRLGVDWPVALAYFYRVEDGSWDCPVKPHDSYKFYALGIKPTRFWEDLCDRYKTNKVLRRFMRSV